jgi:UDP-2-acetamido-2,6-beta-L-arabino-hexul-4-ose reductase
MTEKKILVTGSNGFIGSNLISHLKRNDDYKILTFDIHNTDRDLEDLVCLADFIFHLAGVNRPENEGEFKTGNTDLTRRIITFLEKNMRFTPVLMTSSVQSELDNPYGISKKAAEEVLSVYGQKGGAAYIYRLSNVFGKWCRPNYNSVVATFCHNIAHGKEISISDRNHMVDFVYIDDIVDELIQVFEKGKNKLENYYRVEPGYSVSLGDLADLLHKFHDISKTLCVPDFSNPFVKKLHATYLSYLPEDSFSYKLKLYADNRGDLFELIKSEQFGQIFVSTTKPGVTRGDHYHHSKNEKFCVVRGEAQIKFRHILKDKILAYTVSGKEPEIVDIPPGYTHSITNIGTTEVITLFWANEMFNMEKPDTYFEKVEI